MSPAKRTRTGLDPKMPREEYLRLLARGMSEATLLGHVRGACRQLPGVLIYHTHDSRKSEAGFPDLVIITKAGRLLYRECKTERGRLRPEQRVWLDRLTAIGADAGVWRPSDWVSGAITAALADRPVPAVA